MIFYERTMIVLNTRGITKTEFCKAIGISLKTFYTWDLESTYPNSGRAMRVAQYLGVSLDYLFGRSENSIAYSLLNRTFKKQVLVDYIDSNEFSDEQIEIIHKFVDEAINFDN